MTTCGSGHRVSCTGWVLLTAISTPSRTKSTNSVRDRIFMRGAAWHSPAAGSETSLLLVARRFGRRQARGAGGFLVEAVAQVLARLEVGHALGRHRDLLAGTRIAARPGFALLHREGPEAAQFHAMPAGQGLGDFVEDRGHDPLDIPLIEMRIPGRQAGDQLRLGHCYDNKAKNRGVQA